MRPHLFLFAFHQDTNNALSAEVYTVDIYQKFFAKNPMNRKEGLRFRETVLEHRNYFPSTTARDKFKSDPVRRLRLYLELLLQGRSEDCMGALEKFMGRKLSSKPLVEMLKAPMKRKEKQPGFWRKLAVKLGFR